MKYIVSILIVVFFVSCKNDKSNTPEVTENSESETITAVSDSLIYPGEKHFKSIRQVTFGGDNAEAYWSFDDKQLVFQSNNKAWNVSCDQMFLMNANMPLLVNEGKRYINWEMKFMLWSRIPIWSKGIWTFR